MRTAIMFDLCPLQSDARGLMQASHPWARCKKLPEKENLKLC